MDALENTKRQIIFRGSTEDVWLQPGQHCPYCGGQPAVRLPDDNLFCVCCDRAFTFEGHGSDESAHGVAAQSTEQLRYEFERNRWATLAWSTATEPRASLVQEVLRCHIVPLSKYTGASLEDRGRLEARFHNIAVDVVEALDGYAERRRRAIATPDATPDPDGQQPS